MATLEAAGKKIIHRVCLCMEGGGCSGFGTLKILILDFKSLVNPLGKALPGKRAYKLAV